MTTKSAPACSAPEGPHSKGRSVTLQQFLTLTAASPALALRRAISVALSVETPRSRQAYGRFYCRVIVELGGVPCTDGDHAFMPAVPATA